MATPQTVPAPLPFHEEQTRVALWPVHDPTVVDAPAAPPGPVAGPRTGGRAAARRAARRKSPARPETLRRLRARRPSSSPSWPAAPPRSSPTTRRCGSASTASRAPCTPSRTTWANCSPTRASTSAPTTSSPRAPARRLDNGDEIAVRYGAPGDPHPRRGSGAGCGPPRAPSTGALRQLGVRAEGAYLSASRSRRIGRTGLALDVRTERTVTFMADGRERTVRTNAATVGEAVAEAGYHPARPGHHLRATRTASRATDRRSP